MVGRPLTLMSAIGLARLYEARNMAIKKKKIPYQIYKDNHLTNNSWTISHFGALQRRWRKNWWQARDQVLKEIKEHIKLAHKRMKKVYDGKHREEEFEEEDWVFLKLQPYRQVSVHMCKNAKFLARVFGHFKILKKITPVALSLNYQWCLEFTLFSMWVYWKESWEVIILCYPSCLRYLKRPTCLRGHK